MSHTQNLPPANTNLGNGYANLSSPAGELAASNRDNNPSMGLVYSQPKDSQPQQHHDSSHKQTIHQNINQQNIYDHIKYDHHQWFRYGWPDYDYGRHRTIYVDSYPNPYQIRDDRISQFFIGSATVLGLFIIYRILDKNK